MIKKLIQTLIIFIILSYPAMAQIQTGSVEYDGFQYKFNPQEVSKFQKNAERNWRLFEASRTAEDRVFYLNESMRYYFMLLKVKPSAVDAYIGLGRIYDELGIDSHAKANFFTALNFDKNNAGANYYFGDYYLKRNDLITALTYYKVAYQNGFSRNYQLNYKLAKIYEQLADIEASKSYYTLALKINPKNSELSNKIRLLDELNYSQTQYYLFNDTGKRKK